MMLRRFSTWFLITVLFLTTAGLAGMIRLQIAIDNLQERQELECRATARLNRSIGRILTTVADDPSTSRDVRNVIVDEYDRFSRALADSHHCD